MLSDDIRLTKDSNAKTLILEFEPEKLQIFVEALGSPPEVRRPCGVLPAQILPKSRLIIQSSDERISRELGLALLQWVSRTSYRSNVEEAFGLTPTRSKKKRKKA
jgi:hypothetical protein